MACAAPSGFSRQELPCRSPLPHALSPPVPSAHSPRPESSDPGVARVDRALLRLDGGNDGFCGGCAEPIPAERCRPRASCRARATPARGARPAGTAATSPPRPWPARRRAPCSASAMTSPHVELELPCRGVADADGRAALVAAQMRELLVRQMATTGEGVHDLQLVGVTRNRTQQPVAPGPRLHGVAAGQQGERRVVQPAVAVVQLRTRPFRSGRDVVTAAVMPPVGR